MLASWLCISLSFHHFVILSFRSFCAPQALRRALRERYHCCSTSVDDAYFTGIAWILLIIIIISIFIIAEIIIISKSTTQLMEVVCSLARARTHTHTHTQHVTNAQDSEIETCSKKAFAASSLVPSWHKTVDTGPLLTDRRCELIATFSARKILPMKSSASRPTDHVIIPPSDVSFSFQRFHV